MRLLQVHLEINVKPKVGILYLDISRQLEEEVALRSNFPILKGDIEQIMDTLSNSPSTMICSKYLLRARALDSARIGKLGQYLSERGSELLWKSKDARFFLDEVAKSQIFKKYYPKVLVMHASKSASSIFDVLKRTSAKLPIFVRTEIGSAVKEIPREESYIFDLGIRQIENIVNIQRKLFPQARLLYFKESIIDCEQIAAPPSEVRFFVSNDWFQVDGEEDSVSENIRLMERCVSEVREICRAHEISSVFSLDLMITSQEFVKIVELKDFSGATIREPSKFFQKLREHLGGG